MLTEAVHNRRDAVIGREREREKTRGRDKRTGRQESKRVQKKYRKRGQGLLERKSECKLRAARRTGRSRHSEKDVRRKRREEETARFMTHSRTGGKGKDSKSVQDKDCSCIIHHYICNLSF